MTMLRRLKGGRPVSQEPETREERDCSVLLMRDGSLEIGEWCSDVPRGLPSQNRPRRTGWFMYNTHDCGPFDIDHEQIAEWIPLQEVGETVRVSRGYILPDGWSPIDEMPHNVRTSALHYCRYMQFIHIDGTIELAHLHAPDRYAGVRVWDHVDQHLTIAGYRIAQPLEKIDV